ncbi:hypothetical protein BG000_004954 [Podila horticola]|nr:hypothetical protein BG000_004954 [Podila horticola]
MSSTQTYKPKVLIVGAGIGGISLAILLEKVGIPYQVFERTSEMKFLGSAIALTAYSMPFLKQIGVYDDFLKIAKEFWTFDQYNERREFEFKMDIYPIFEIFCHVKGDNKPYSWMTVNTADNRICWIVIEYLEQESSKANDSYRSSEWGREATESMCKLIYDYPITVGAEGSQMAMEQLLDKTPKHLISKVMEEKIHIASGAGTTNAMQDAVVLSNWIAALPHLDDQDTEKIFEEYKKERYPVVMATYYVGRTFSKVAGTSLISRIVRFLTKNVPKFLWMIVLKIMAESRPQVWFLKLVEDRGTVRPTDQPSLKKNLAMVAAKRFIPKSVPE